jgi:hypothetical protein
MRWPSGSLAVTSGVACFAILSSALAQDASPAKPGAASTVDAASAEPQPNASQDDAPQAPVVNAVPPSAAPSERFDPANGAVGQADQARGWDTAPGVEDADVALFLPRAVLFLPKLVLSAVFWLPEQAFKAIDNLHLIQRAEAILYFDDAHQFGWTPLIAYQSGYGPTGGAEVFHKSLFGHAEEISVTGVYGGQFTQAYRFAFNADRLGGSRMWLDTQARFEAQPGLLFGGFGISESDNAPPGPGLNPRQSNALTYLSQDRVLGLIRVGYTAGERRELVKFGATAILNHREFDQNAVHKRQVAAVYDTNQIPGFNDQVTTLELQGNLVMDLRENRGLDTRGLYMESFFGGVPELDKYRYLHYGIELAYTIDLYKATRLLRLRVGLEAVEGRASQIPFSDLPRLGGGRRLRGYREAQFRDERASLASIEYHYPIHRNVAVELFIDTGYVSEHYRDLYKLNHWKIGYGGGFLFGSPGDIAIRLDLAYGDRLAFYLTTDLAQAFDGRSEQL